MNARFTDEYDGLSSTFARACREADRRQSRRPQPEPIPSERGVPSASFLQSIYEGTIARRRAESKPTPTPADTPFRVDDIDDLDLAIEVLRPFLDRALPIKKRIHTFWAFVRATRNCGDERIHSEFTRLACETGLTADLGWHGQEDLEHVLSWGLRDMNPFEKGPLR
jgi:hypothetical protein